MEFGSSWTGLNEYVVAQTDSTSPDFNMEISCWVSFRSGSLVVGVELKRRPAGGAIAGQNNPE